MTWDNARRLKAAWSNRERQGRHDEIVRPHLAECRAARIGFAGMARLLTERGVATPGRFIEGRPGGVWTATMAKRIHDRLFFRCNKTGDLFAAAHAKPREEA